MNWSEVDSVFAEYKENLLKSGIRIQTAKRLGGELHHANHRPWYLKRVKVARQRFQVLKRRLATFPTVSRILSDLETSLAKMSQTQLGIGEVESAYTLSKTLSDSLESEIRNEQMKGFDILPREPVARDNRLCFVMMPFKPRRQFDPVYKRIRNAVRKTGLRCIRADEVWDTRAVILDIWENLRKCRVGVADITGRNANVFYELGMGHTIPKRVVLICEELQRHDKPVFDVNYVRCLFYRNNLSGLAELEKKIVKTLKTALR